MLRTLDNLYFRFREAWWVITRPNYLDLHLDRAYKDGKERGFALVRRALDEHDPYQFQNEHFKLGYYYAYEQAKKVMNLDEDNIVD